MRELHAEFSSGELHFTLNGVNGPGQWTIEHHHDAPHTVIPLSPLSPVRVEAIVAGERVSLDARIDGHRSLPSLNGGVVHRVGVESFTVWTPEMVRARAEEIAAALNLVEGKWYCAFSRRSGALRADPKIWTGNPVRLP